MAQIHRAIKHIVQINQALQQKFIIFSIWTMQQRSWIWKSHGNTQSLVRTGSFAWMLVVSKLRFITACIHCSYIEKLIYSCFFEDILISEFIPCSKRIRSLIGKCIGIVWLNTYKGSGEICCLRHKDSII